MGETKSKALKFAESVLKDEAARENASKKTLDEILQMAREQGFDITEDELKAAVTQVSSMDEEIELDDLSEVAGGTAFVAGTRWQNTKLFCPDNHKYIARTGNQREDYRYIWWSQHQWEYRCPSCGFVCWEDEEVDDPPRTVWP